MAAPRAESTVDVVYATVDEQRIVRVPFVDGLTAEQAARASGLIEALPDLASRPLMLGVFGVRVAPHYELAPGDRVEICRPLPRDPRDRRRNLAKP
jgi:putative ubiquitin-RnfH superfamily antitoxin RatB of RatAB toxin-antitoxin module